MNIPKTINIKGHLIDFATPHVMGILNVTPDSFYANSRKMSENEIVKQVELMAQEGATFLDVGGYSSRPGAVDISVNEEIDRLKNPIKEISRRFPDMVLSIDTFRSEVAQAACDLGASMVNDISGGDLDAKMFETVAKLRVPYVAMHMRGIPQNMVSQTDYQDVVKEVTQALVKKVKDLSEMGVADVILDPGFGFAKNIEQNFQLLEQLAFLGHIGKPLLVGLSRKSMIYKSLNIAPEEALNGTTVLNTIALLKGASILRVHDVKEAVEAVKLIKRLEN